MRNGTLIERIMKILEKYKYDSGTTYGEVRDIKEFREKYYLSYLREEKINELLK